MAFPVLSPSTVGERRRRALRRPSQKAAPAMMMNPTVAPTPIPAAAPALSPPPLPPLEDVGNVVEVVVVAAGFEPPVGLDV
jgi:hypothetical protein